MIELLGVLVGVACLAWAAATWLRRTEPDAAVAQMCPRTSERLHPDDLQGYSASRNVSYHKCSECGRWHVWQWGPPAPIYVGDKIRLKVTSDGVAEAELDAP